MSDVQTIIPLDADTLGGKTREEFEQEIVLLREQTTNNIGNLSELEMEGATNLVEALNQTFQFGNERKEQLVSNLVAMGIQADTSESLEVLISKVLDIFTGTDVSNDTVVASVLLKGYTAHGSDGNLINGQMENNGAVSKTLGINGTYTIPAGYHNGQGKVTQNVSTKGAITYTPNTSDQTIQSGQYLSGNQTIKGDSNLVSANIKSGVSIFGVSGNANVVDTSAGDAVAGDIVKNKKAYVDGALVTGTLNDKTGTTEYTATPTLDNTNKELEMTIPEAGKYGTNNKLKATFAIIASLIGLTSKKLASGNTILGISGDSNVVDTSAGDAVASHILSGKIAYVDGAKVTGTMANKSGSTEYTATPTLDNTNKELEMTVPANGYYSTSNKLKATFATIASLIGLTSAKLVKGNTILGITGNSNNMDTSGGDASASHILNGKKACVDGSLLTGAMNNYDNRFIWQVENTAFSKYLGKYTFSNGSTVTDMVALQFTSDYVGYYGTNSKIIVGRESEIAPKILKGQTVCQVDGTATSDANAVAGNIENGKTAYVNGAKITGNLMNVHAAKLMTLLQSLGWQSATPTKLSSISWTKVVTVEVGTSTTMNFKFYANAAFRYTPIEEGGWNGWFKGGTYNQFDIMADKSIATYITKEPTGSSTMTIANTITGIKRGITCGSLVLKDNETTWITFRFLIVVI